MVLGWELVKYGNSRTTHDLYYWENTSDGARSEVDYIIAKDMKIRPIECKAGTSGKMKSLWIFMKNKKIDEAYRCSLENFSMLTRQDDNINLKIHVVPLYAVSNIV